MPRNGSGTYTLPSGNPVVSGTIIESTWANSTLADLADAITNSLARNGEGGMTAPLRLTDGVVATPSLAFANETGSGLYRAAAGDLGLSVLGSRILRLQAAGASVTGTLGVSGDTSLASLAYTGTLTGGTGVINIGSGQVYKDASGNVGIGTSSPSAKLQLQSGFFHITNGTQTLRQGVISGAGLIGTQSNDSLVLFTFDTERMRISSAGLAGIGIANGTAKLEVAGTSPNNAGARATYEGTIKINEGGLTSLEETGGLEFKGSVFGSGYGVKLVGLDNGQLLIGTRNNSATWTERVRITSAGDVGIGTASPGAKLDVTVAGANLAQQWVGTSGVYHRIGTASSSFYTVHNGSTDTFLYTQEAAALRLGTSGAERVRITSAGDVGIGITTPFSKLDVNGSFTSRGATEFVSTTVSQTWTGNTYGGFSLNNGTVQLGLSCNSSLAELRGITNHPLAIYTNNAERVRITSAGDLLVGTTSNAPTSGGMALISDGYIRTSRGTTSTATQLEFRNPNGIVGSISTDGSSTSYNTSSDYRLKENVAPMTGALYKVAQLKPVTYNWKVDGSAGQGFIAHELQEVIPDCVTGEKDAMRTEKYEISPAVPATYDEEGNELTPAIPAVMGEREVPEYQGVDTSFLVATLVAAIQELKAEVDALKAVA